MSRWKRRLAAGAMAALLFAALLSALYSARAQGAPTWSRVNSLPPGDVTWYDVFMRGREEAWLAGKLNDTQGILARYELRGAVWTLALASTYKYPLHAVVATAPDQLWAVGEGSTILHAMVKDRDLTWTEMPVPVDGAQLLTIQMLGNGEEGWAGGTIASAPGNANASVLLHYKAGGWSEDSSIKTSVITSLHFAESSGWAVGNGIWRYERGQWSSEAEEGPCQGCYPFYYGVRAISNSEARAVGEYASTCGICEPHAWAIHRTGDKWQGDMPQYYSGTPTAATSRAFSSSLRDIYFTGNDFGIAVGYVEPAASTHPQPFRVYAMSYRSGTWWQDENLPALEGTLYGVSLADKEHGLAVGTNGIILSYGYGDQPQPSLTPGPTQSPQTTAMPTATAQPYPTYPTARVPDPHDPNVVYFAPVGHTLRGPFHAYWEQHGGLAQFGYPITEEFQEASATDGKTYTVQYFQRARFEHHAENKPPYDVLLGLLGRTITQGRENEPPFRPATQQATPGGLYFPETQHNILPEFARYWQQRGGLPVYGYPISEPFTEVSPTDGKPYTVQYFERNRFELHLELPEPYRVSLGLLGVQVVGR